MTAAPLPIEEKLFLQPLQELVQNLRFSRRLERLWDFVEKNYPDPQLRLEKVAAACGVSKNHLNVLLRSETALTFYELLTRYRLFQSIRLMGRKNYSLSEIAEQCGFGSESSLRRHFHRILGCSPKEFRKSAHSRLRRGS